MVDSITRPEVPETLKPEFTPSRAMRAALVITARGKPVFPCRHAPEKSPLTGRGGFHKATTDRRMVHGFWNANPGASIGVPTGERGGFFVLDVDRMEALDELPGDLPETLAVRTPRGGLHLYFEHGEGVTNSSGGLPKGLDVRGEGGYILVPPSPGYTVEGKAEIAAPPEWLLEMIRQSSGGSPGASRQTSITVGTDGPTIFEGTRHTTLTSIAGRVFTGDVDQLEADLQAVNEHRCEPPLAQVEITKMARWFHGKEPCGKREDPEVEEVLDHAGAFWYEALLRGGGRSKVRDVFRALLTRSARFASLTTVEGKRAVEWADSYREIAETAGTSAMSVQRALAKLQAMGAVRVSRVGKSRESRSTMLIIEPAHYRYSQTIGSYRRPVDDCNGSARPSRPDRLETPIYRWRGHVGNSKGGVQAALEAFGPQTPEELAERLGVSRARDLVRRHLEPMVALELVEDRGGTWALRGDHRERAEDLRREPFVTVSRRRRERRDGDRMVRWVEETELDASEIERAEMTRERHRRERERFREKVAREAEVESVGFDQLPDATPDQLADARYRFEERRYRRNKTYGHAVDERSEDTALGGTVAHEGYVVERDTGEIVGESHAPDCECVGCEHGRLSSEREEGAA